MILTDDNRFVPETKRRHLEDLDAAFSTPYSKSIPPRIDVLLKPFLGLKLIAKYRRRETQSTTVNGDTCSGDESQRIKKEKD